MKIKKLFNPKSILFIIIPILFLIWGLNFDRTKYSTDPESAYLINGINIATGKFIGHTDNPGTPVQVFSAVVLRISYLFQNNDTDFQTEILTNSEKYIEILRYTSIALIFVTLLMLGLFGNKYLKNIFLALSLQIVAFTSLTLLEELYTKVAPEPFLFIITSVLILYCFHFINKTSQSNKSTLVFALIIGFGIACKFTFIPLAIIPFILLSRNQRLKYLLLIIPSFILFTFPAIPSYPGMIKWLLSIITHTGTYGQGSKGIIDFSQYSINLVNMAKVNPYIFIIGLISAVWLIALYINKKQKKTNSTIYLFAVSLAILLNILMVAKHYHTNHYLFPALSLLAVQIVLLFISISEKLKPKVVKNFSFIPFIVLLLTTLTSIPKAAEAQKGYKASNISTEFTQNLIKEKYSDKTQIYYYPVSVNEFTSLRWGNVYARRKHTERLKEIYPNGLFYHSWENKIQFWDDDISNEELLEKYGDDFILVGGPLNDDELKQVKDNGFDLTLLHSGRVQAVFQINIKTSEYFNKKLKFDKFCDFESIDTISNIFYFNDTTLFSDTKNLSQEVSKSGSNAIKVDKNEGFALEFIFTDLEPKDSFTVKGWFKGKNPDAYIVVSDLVDNTFYHVSAKLDKANEDWQETILNFKIPENFTQNKLKIYLWNPGKENIYFDDFEFIKY